MSPQVKHPRRRGARRSSRPLLPLRHGGRDLASGNIRAELEPNKQKRAGTQPPAHPAPWSPRRRLSHQHLGEVPGLHDSVAYSTFGKTRSVKTSEIGRAGDPRLCSGVWTAVARRRRGVEWRAGGRRHSPTTVKTRKKKRKKKKGRESEEEPSFHQTHDAARGTRSGPPQTLAAVISR